MRDLTPGLMTNSISAVQAAFDSGSAGEKSTFQAAVSGASFYGLSAYSGWLAAGTILRI